MGSKEATVDGAFLCQTGVDAADVIQWLDRPIDRLIGGWPVPPEGFEKQARRHPEACADGHLAPLGSSFNAQVQWTGGLVEDLHLFSGWALTLTIGILVILDVGGCPALCPGA